MAIAALAQLSGRRPLVVACPTGASAGQLFDDLTQFMPEGDVVHFPAWETLPFERVSPSVETMGQRLEVLWRLRNPDRTPAIVVAGVRALLQKLGPGATTTRTDRRPAERDRRSRRADRDARRVRVPARGVGRAPRRVRPARGDRRRVPVDRQRTDPHRPVGRRGRPADALRRQRSALDGRPRRGDDLPGARADADRRRQPPRRRPRSPPSRGDASSGSVSPRASTSTGWSRGCRGSSTRTGCSPTSCRRHAKVVLIEPRRMRDRATELLAEEDDLAKALASTWARDPDKAFPRLHASPDALLASSGSFWTIDSTPESPETPVVRGVRVGPGRRRRERADEAARRVARPAVPRRRRRRRRRLGAAAARVAARARPRPPRRRRTATT